MNNPFLIGKKIYFRAPEESDAEIYALSENHPDPRVTLYYGMPTTIEQQKEKIRLNAGDPNTVIFTICTTDDDKPIGTTSLIRIHWIGRAAIFYIAIAEKENWSKGYGGEATQMMVDYAFATLNLNRIQLHVSIENKPGVKVYQNTGFKIEGTLRQAMYRDNHYSDFYVMGILKEDWLAEQKKR